ncbi:MAG: peptidoglycan-associated lipoprotein Pal [Alphaproteobacteria bacterium]|nr:MAG: peptidoglycan-associated lipoprotein Pal [Alphaproteobacteria bacterium]
MRAGRILTMAAALVMVAACSSNDDEASRGMVTGQAVTGPGVGGHMGPGGAGAVRPGSQEELVTVGDRVFFDFNSSDLTSEGRAVLDRQASWMKQNASVNVTVEGHCDERGTREYNLALGERRAQSVKNYMVAAGIAESRVQTISYGKERPAVPGSNESSWSQNRRGVTVVN